MILLIFLISLFSTPALSANTFEKGLDLEALPAREISLVQLSFDGVYSHYSGVGQVVQNINNLTCELNEQYRDQVHFQVNLFSCDYPEHIPERSQEVLNKNRALCKSTGGDVYLVDSPHENIFGDPNQWRTLCSKSADGISKIINESLFTLIVCHDTAYAQVPIYLDLLKSQGLIQGEYKVICVPHSMSWTYDGYYPNFEAKWPERHNWELTAFQGAKTYGYTIGYINEKIKDALTSPPFHIPEQSLMHFKTGIIPDKYEKQIPYCKIEEELEKRNIPLDKTLLFSIGRANPLKGQDIVLEVYKHLSAVYSDLHLVMLAPPSEYMPEYIDLLKRRIENEKLEVTFLDYFDPDLDQYIYQWPHTALSYVLSREDTQPLTVMEARVNPQNSLLVASNCDGVSLQLNHGVDGFIVEIDDLDEIIQFSEENRPASIENLIKCSEEVIEISDDDRKRMLSNGKQLILSKYNFRKNWINNLNSLFKGETDLQFQSSVNLLNECKDDLSQLLFLPQEITFQKIGQGMVNSPIGLFDTKGQALGVLKHIPDEVEISEARLEVLSEMMALGFKNLPALYQNIHQKFVTKIGSENYYFTELLPSQDREVTFEEMLSFTGLFHQYSREVVARQCLEISKLDEYLSRYEVIFDPWFEQNYPSLFSGNGWKEAKKLGQYFASSEFKEIYSHLPKAIIHGDNNQTNILLNKDSAFFIDLDSVRYDTRLLDLASYFRFGGFENYLLFKRSGKILSVVDHYYGKNANSLNADEKEALDDLVKFSHIEFLSWLLKSVKSHELKGCASKDSLLSCISNCLRQLDQLSE